MIDGEKRAWWRPHGEPHFSLSYNRMADTELTTVCGWLKLNGACISRGNRRIMMAGSAFFNKYALFTLCHCRFNQSAGLRADDAIVIFFSDYQVMPVGGAERSYIIGNDAGDAAHQ